MRNATPVAVALLVLAARGAAAEDEKKDKPAAPVDVPGFWTQDELRRIDEGLDVLNCTRKDLGFQKRPIDDPFRLTVVNRILDEPLAIGDVALTWDRMARSGDASILVLESIYAIEAARGDVTGAPRTARSAPDLESILPALPESVHRNFILAAQDVGAAADKVRVAFTPVGADLDGLLAKSLLSQVEHPATPAASATVDDATFLSLARKPDRPRLLISGFELCTDVDELVKALKAAPPATWASITKPIRASTTVGDIVLYGTGDDVHGPEDDDAVLVIDLGGNDTYTHGASANLLKNRPVQVVIDLAGDDKYVGSNDFSFGGALGGVAIQWDCGGNDTYLGGNCSCGAGILGVGVLVDEDGNDTYRIKDFGEGAGAFGIGLLLDKGGNDFFHADLYGQGFGSTWGCGMLVEMAGNDVYDAGGEHVDEPLWRDRYASLSQGFGFGGRPDRSGGVGVLVDVSGNDRYSCDIFGQGCSYWFSLGLLIDDDGHDTYCCGQYGQGSGIHLSCGMLLDRHGQDSYYDANGVGMGGAHDYAVGFLVDRDGDDYYAGGGCAQGSGHTNSVGMLIDDAGDDGYSTVRGVSQGGASWVRSTGGIGLLLDGAGHDQYSEKTRDDRVLVRETVAACIDEPTPAEKASENPMNAAISKEDAEKKVETEGRKDGAWDLDKLWAMVSAWEVGDNTVIMPIARERFFALGRPALDRAFANFDDKHGLAIRGVEFTLREFAKTDRAGVVARLIEKTRDPDKLVRKNAVLLVMNLQVTEALPRLTEMLTTDPDTTGGVLAALAAMKTAPPEVVAMLKHSRESVGVQAAVCLAAAAAESKEQPDLSPLIAALGPDYPFPVRLAAQERLASLGSRACTALACWDDLPTTMAQRAALRALGGTKDPRAGSAIERAFASKDPMIRLSAMLAADDLVTSLGAKASQWLAAARARAHDAETDPLVRRLLDGGAK
jgi:hypothetical protein